MRSALGTTGALISTTRRYRPPESVQRGSAKRTQPLLNHNHPPGAGSGRTPLDPDKRSPQPRSRAAKIAEITGDRAGQAVARYQLGYAYGTLGQYPAAIKSFGAAIDLYRDLGDLPGQVDAGTFRSHTFTGIDDFAAATASATNALALAREGGYRLGEADALFALSAAQGGVGDYQAAATSLTPCHVGLPFRCRRDLQGL